MSVVYHQIATFWWKARPLQLVPIIYTYHICNFLSGWFACMYACVHKCAHVWACFSIPDVSTRFFELKDTLTYWEHEQNYSQICLKDYHADVIKWIHFPRNGKSAVNSPHKGQWHRALMFSLIYIWINGWVNNREAGDLRRHQTHYDVTVMSNNYHEGKCIVICISSQFVHY